MRILHVIPAVAARYGGPSVATVGMCRALQSRGVHACIASTDADGAGRLPVELGIETTFEGVPAVFFRRRATESFKWGPGLAVWLRSHVARFDVVHVHAVFSHSSIAAARACVRAGVPYIVRPLGTLDPWSVSRKPWRKRALRVLGVDALLRGAAAMHYTSREEQRLAESVVANLPDGAVIPIGIDGDAFASQPFSPVAEPYVLSLSRLEEKKGIDVLIRAFDAATRDAEFSAWRLVVAGTGDDEYLSRLRELAAASGASRRIDFRGWVAGAQKRELLAGARLFAAPSHQENFGIAIVEAMAAGVPVLATPGVNLAQEIESAGGGWMTPLNESAVACALRDLLRDPVRLADARPRAREFADRFRWPAVTGALMDLYSTARARHARLTPLDA